MTLQEKINKMDQWEVMKSASDIEKIIESKKGCDHIIDDLVEKIPDDITERTYLYYLLFIYHSWRRGKDVKLAANIAFANMVQNRNKI